ncbi:MAG TPA: radical SAM protein, partial [Flavobacteriaceae bacterium]|nr:radical SAM protein [Flavobacteriaceae bacterium]
MAGIYIHIPFCKQACYYCNFHFSVSKKLKDDMLQAMEKEILIRKDELKNEIVETIYFGGGTPSVLTIDEVKQFLKTINYNFNTSNKVEITFEANPDDLKLSYIKQLRKAGVYRLSIGVQSFFDEDLKFMNRAHNA